MAKEKWIDWEIYKRDRCRCVYCGFNGRNNVDKFRQLDIDHLVPKHKGEEWDGYRDSLNKVVACVYCNRVVKRDYNPLGDHWRKPATAEEHLDLVSKAREHVLASDRWKDDTLDFLVMMAELDKLE